ncbi:hypothetical protein J6590_036360 [Homalodisca vitripennis]|nr:hypothetical protein J6590_036360 [Homalodisca vitripennis]
MQVNSVVCHPVTVCPSNDAFERVTCPDYFYCCGTHQCCKLTFPEEDAEGESSLNDWLSAFCVRIVILSVFMIILLAIGKVIQYCKKHYLGKLCPGSSNLPRYKPLDKNSIASDIDTISALVGTPIYQVNNARIGKFQYINSEHTLMF